MFYGLIINSDKGRIFHRLDTVRDIKQHAHWYDAIGRHAGWVRAAIDIIGGSTPVARGRINIGGVRPLATSKAIITPYGHRFTWEPFRLAKVGMVTPTLVGVIKERWLDRLLSASSVYLSKSKRPSPHWRLSR